MANDETKMTTRRFEAPDERRPFPRGHMEVVALGGLSFGLTTFEPGWKWSESLKPLVGTESCRSEHLGYMLSGRLATRMDDGAETEFREGDLVHIPPGHDGWTVGDEPVVLLQILAASEYPNT